MSNSLGPHGLYSPWNSSNQNTEVGSLSLLQGIFLTQDLNWGLLYCRQILYQLSYQGSPIYLHLIFTKCICMYAYGKGNGNPLWYFCLENSMDGGAW